MKTGIYSRRIKKYIIYISCVMMIMCGAVSPVHADEDETIHIHLTVENDIWDSGSGAPWQGRLMERDIAATHDETIEDILKKAFSDEHKEISFKSSRVTAAAGISDGDAGSRCRWKLSMNGTDTEVRSSDIKAAGYLSDGDRIRLYYSGVVDASSDDTSVSEDNGAESGPSSSSAEKNSDEKDDAAGIGETAQQPVNADTNDDSTVTDSDVQADGEDTAVIPEPEGEDSSPEENEDVSLPETLSAEQVKAAAGVSNDVKQAHDDAGKVISEAGIPSVGDVGGEWSVIGRIRSGQIRDIETDGYYLNAVNYIMMSEGSSDICETARLILGLTAAGRDVSDAGGRDLLKDVSDLDAVLEGGVRSAAMVLIALDSKQYSIPDAEQGRKQTSRDALVKYLTGAAENSGGWTADGSPDAGITAVALQALAPYHKKDASVKKTADKALEYLSKVQCSDGTFGPDKDTGSSAQVIIALTSIGIDPASDSRFIKDGMSAVDGLMSRYIPGSGFSAVAGGGADASATEQAYNALTAYELFAKGESSLYDMTDIPTVSDKKAAAEVTDMIAALGRITLDSADDIRAARTAYDALTDCGRKLVSNYDVLTAAEKKLAALKKEKDKNSGSGKDKKKTDSGETAKQITRMMKAVTKTMTKSGRIKLGGDVRKAISLINAVLDPADPSDRLPDDMSKITDEQLAAVIAAYKEYDDLSEDDRLLVKNYKEFEKVLEKIGDSIHQDKKTGINVSGLQWKYRLVVSEKKISEENRDSVSSILGKDSELMVLYDISLTDIVTGKSYEPDKPVSVRIPEPDMKGHGTAVIMHINDDGRYEMIKCSKSGDFLEFKAQSFSPYGVAGMDGSWEDVLDKEKQKHIPFPIMIIGAAALLALAALVIAGKKLRSSDEN